jgi:predicted O-methyltransferase YrrM
MEKNSKIEFSNIYDVLNIHNENLKALSIKYLDSSNDIYGLEGNVYTYDGKNTTEFMKDKMLNIYCLAQECKGDVLEIGFNAGNSALLFLLANPNIKLHAVDKCVHSYVKPCVEYLNKHFDNRVSLYEGDSLKVMPSLDRSLKDTVEIYHIDGWHVKEGIQADMKNCYELAKKNAYVIIDDCNNMCINDEVNTYILDNKIVERKDKVIVTPLQWHHRIAQYKNTFKNL